MHSSKMRTARLLTVSGGGGVCPTLGVCICGVCILGVCLQGGLPNNRGSASGRGCASWGLSNLGGLHPGGGVCPTAGGRHRGVCPTRGWADPPVNRMTYRCKNITLPQTSFAGGNKYDTDFTENNTDIYKRV